MYHWRHDVKCYTFWVSTLVNESLEIETTGMDLLDETVAEEHATELITEPSTEPSTELSMEDSATALSEVNSNEVEQNLNAISETVEVEELAIESDEKTLESDVIELKSEDLADIRATMTNESEDVVAKESQKETTESVVELVEDTDAVEDIENDAVALSESETDKVSVSQEELEVSVDALPENNIDPEASDEIEMLNAEASTDEDAEVSVDALSEDVNDSEESDDTEIVGTPEAKASQEEIDDDTVEDAVASEVEEDNKPSRSRALLLTSLLSTTKPISIKELKKVLKISEKAILAAIADLKTTLYEQDLGLMMEEVAGGYRVIIQPALYADLAELISPPPLPQLSSAALETLAIISYKQPITRGELEAARGTGCSSTLDTLQERDLIKIVGQKDVVGKPLLYGTTERFLLEFGLKSLEDLPPLDEKPTEFLRS